MSHLYLRIIERPRQTALVGKGGGGVWLRFGAPAPPKYLVDMVSSVSISQFSRRIAHEILEDFGSQPAHWHLNPCRALSLDSLIFPHRLRQRWTSAISTSVLSIQQLETKPWYDCPILSFLTSTGIRSIQSNLPMLLGSRPTRSRLTGNRQMPMRTPSYSTSPRALCELKKKRRLTNQGVL